MSRPSPTPAEPFAEGESNDELRRRCGAYLDGTLPAEQIAGLESRFADPVVAKILEQESEWLIRTTMAVSTEAVPIRQSTSSNDLPRRYRPVPSTRRLISVIATLAATVLLAISWTGRSASDSFEMQLARAFAEPSMNWDADTESLAVEDVADWQSDLDDADWETNDESLQWMLVAVEPILINQEDNDG